MGLLNLLTTGSWDEPAPAAAPPPPSSAPSPTPQQSATALAQAAQAQLTLAQSDAEGNLCQQDPTQSGGLPCARPQRKHPCDLRSLKVTETKTKTEAKAPWIGEGEASSEPPAEREHPASFTIVTGGSEGADPYVTGTVIEVTAGVEQDQVKTTIELVVDTDYKFCAQESHPHLLITSTDKGLTQPPRGTRRHSFKVYRRPRATDASTLRTYLDIWPFSFKAQDYVVSAIVCGMRDVGTAVGSQTTTIRVYPNEQWKLKIVAPSLFSGSVSAFAGLKGSELVAEGSASMTTHLGGASTSRTLEAGYGSSSGATSSYDYSKRFAPGGSGPQSIGYSRETDREGTKREFSRTYKDKKSGDTMVVRTERLGAAPSTTKVTRDNRLGEGVAITLERDGKEVAALETIRTAINAFRELQLMLKALFDLLDALPKWGISSSFSAEVFTGSFEAAWGFKEWTDRRVFYAWGLTVKLTLLSLTFKVGFTFDLTISGYGFYAGIEFVIDGASVSISNSMARTAPGKTEASLSKIEGAIPAKVEARVMALADRVFQFTGSVNSGFEMKGDFGQDDRGIRVQVERVDWTGITLEGTGTIIGVFEVKGSFVFMERRKVGGPYRVPG